MFQQNPTEQILLYNPLTSKIATIFSEEFRPSILVSDILWQYGEPETLTTSHLLLRRKDAPPVIKNQSPSIEHSFEEREAAYLAARERIFSTDVCTVAEPVRQKPRTVPVVARRMIAHALGQKMKTLNQDGIVKDSKECEQTSSEVNIQDDDRVGPSSSLEACQDTTYQRDQTGNSVSKAKTNPKYNTSSRGERTVPRASAEKSSTDVSTSRNGRSKSSVSKEYSKEQHVGAARRMFAHALGLHSAKDGSHLK